MFDTSDHPSRHHLTRSAHYGCCTRSYTACPSFTISQRLECAPFQNGLSSRTLGQTTLDDIFMQQMGISNGPRPS
ncbi:hypothetical protein CY34DRAFT_804169 [Suillus luteus UH-Slu-Lm8-n1]|uniref:Uncharacterized protein n=1 Tax=Suillus luteus UH-Slu-Lm8-n1 TaxID=930992 RepID=A0A0D0B9S4_9AGAM|nr:hypothetical protein CY34DRAFT_804169 [Suillus luteus UH-Slu-Lm8-n1]